MLMSEKMGAWVLYLPASCALMHEPIGQPYMMHTTETSYSSSSVQDSSENFHDSSSDSSEGIASEEVGWEDEEAAGLNAI